MKRLVVVCAASAFLLSGLAAAQAATPQLAVQDPPGGPADPASAGPDLTPLAVIAGAVVGIAVGSVVGWELIPIYAGVEPELVFGTGVTGVNGGAAVPLTPAVMSTASTVMTIAQTTGAAIGGYVGAVLYWNASGSKP
jgi:hypothetical protein